MPDLPDLLPRYDPGPGRHVRAGMVLSADGGGAWQGRSRALSTPADRAVFRVLRAHADVVLVGAGTARDEAYGPVVLSEEHRAWRQAAGRPPTPPLAVLSRSGAVPQVEGAIVLSSGDALADVLDELAGRGLTRVLCEGGPDLLGQLVIQGLLDELCTTLSPRLLGRQPGIVAADLPAPVELRLAHVVEHDGSLLLRWQVRH